MKIGIDKISFYVPNTYLDLKTLAKHRNVDYLKYKNGLFLNKMSVESKDEDIISMAANASLNILSKEDISKIDLVLFATESGLDYSKSAATHLISILGLRNNVRALELKQACYSTAAAIYFAKGHILQHPNSKVLVVASDAAKYGLNTSGEPTQGAGAVAMIISRDPKILELENNYGVYTENLYDFYRPSGSKYALVDGSLSNDTYQKFFLKTFEDYIDKSKYDINDFKALTFHIPYGKLGLKTLRLVADEKINKDLFINFNKAITYNREIGNIYTGSLFLSLISLLESASLLENDRIGLYAYGSGSVAEFFSGKLVKGYKDHLNKDLHNNLLDNRQELDINEYEAIMLADEINNEVLPTNTNLVVQLKSVKNYQRVYQVNK